MTTDEVPIYHTARRRSTKREARSRDPLSREGPTRRRTWPPWHPFGPGPVALKPFTAYLIYAVGSLTNNTFTFVIKPIENLKGEPTPKKKEAAQPQGRSLRRGIR